MTLGTIWGLVQISVLMGYGLVLLPQNFEQKNVQTMYEIALCQVDKYEEAKDQANMDMEYLVASAKGIRNLRLHHDTVMLDAILAKLPQDLVNTVPGTVLADDIDDKFKKSAVALHQATKLALLAQRQT